MGERRKRKRRVDKTRKKKWILTEKKKFQHNSKVNLH